VPRKTKEERAAYAREWRRARADQFKRPHANPQYVKRADRRDSTLISKYGIAAAEFDALRISQDGRCAICPETERLVVDHDHDTGRVRGLLCGACNKMLGFARDCPTNLLKGAKYLQKV
jgi:hypothetical protein